MTDAWVVNASPIIVLAKAGYLSLLEEQGIEVLVPDAVAREVLAGPDTDPGRKALEAGWGIRLDPVAVPPLILEWSLGAGESEVLARVSERPGRVGVLDDAEARACARTLDVPLIGTLGVILRARRKGRIESAAQVARDLLRAGYFIEETLLRRVLDLTVGESLDGLDRHASETSI